MSISKYLYFRKHIIFFITTPLLIRSSKVIYPAWAVLRKLPGHPLEKDPRQLPADSWWATGVGAKVWACTQSPAHPKESKLLVGPPGTKRPSNCSLLPLLTIKWNFPTSEWKQRLFGVKRVENIGEREQKAEAEPSEHGRKGELTLYLLAFLPCAHPYSYLRLYPYPLLYLSLYI